MGSWLLTDEWIGVAEHPQTLTQAKDAFVLGRRIICQTDWIYGYKTPGLASVTNVGVYGGYKRGGLRGDSGRESSVEGDRDI